jgi:hypothetical protein
VNAAKDSHAEHVMSSNGDFTAEAWKAITVELDLPAPANAQGA